MCAILFICLFKNRIPNIHPTRSQKLARSRLERSCTSDTCSTICSSQHPFCRSGAPAVSFMQDRPNVFVQLASSSDAKRIFDQCHERHLPWPLCGYVPLILCPPFAIICTLRWHPSAMKSKACFCAARLGRSARAQRSISSAGLPHATDTHLLQYLICWVPMAPLSVKNCSVVLC